MAAWSIAESSAGARQKDPGQWLDLPVQQTLFPCLEYLHLAEQLVIIPHFGISQLLLILMLLLVLGLVF